MSHFVVAVLVPGETQPEQLEEVIETLLAPFDENTEVEPYPSVIEDDDLAAMRQCYGVDDLATLVAHMPDWNNCTGMVEDGKLYAWKTYNPASKWDWWRIGGRWADKLPGSMAKVRELPEDFTVRAIVAPGNNEHPESFWFQKGEMGWFGMSYGDKSDEQWQQEQSEILSAFPNHLCVVVDCHI